MKIALITSSAPYGKGESFVIAEANALTRTGAQIFVIPTIIRSRNQYAGDIRPDITVVSHSVISRTILKSFLRSALTTPGDILKALRCLCSKNPLTLFKNLVVFPKAVWLSGWAKQNNIAHIHAHWVSTPSTVAMIASLLSGIPWSCTAHRSDIVSNNLLNKKLLHASFVRFISESGIALAAKVCGSVHDKARLLHMGVDIPDIPLFLKRDEGKEYTVLCPANMVRVKGHSFLIHACSSLITRRPVKLLLAGDGPLQSKLENLVSELKLSDSVEFLGHIPHADLLSKYRNGEIDLVVLPSLDLGNGEHEGIPVSLIEAMSFGIPVVSTFTGGIPELLSGGAGIMVPHSNSTALAKAIEDMVNMSDQFHKQSKLGLMKISAEFNNKIIASTLISWFEEQVAE